MVNFFKGDLFLPVDQQHNLKIQMKYRFEIPLILLQGHYVIGFIYSIKDVHIGLFSIIEIRYPTWNAD